MDGSGPGDAEDRAPAGQRRASGGGGKVAERVWGIASELGADQTLAAIAYGAVIEVSIAASGITSALPWAGGRWQDK